MRNSKFTISVLFLVFLSACSSTSTSQTGTFYDVVIDSYGNQPTSKNFIVLPATKDLGQDQLRFQTNERVLARVLTSIGMTQATDAAHADIQVALFYDMKEEDSHDDLKVPTYVSGVPGSVDPGRMIHSGIEKIVLPLTGSKYLRYVLVTAVDRITHQDVWETSIISRGTSNELSQVVPILIAAGRDFYGKPSHGRENKTVFDSDSQIREFTCDK